MLPISPRRAAGVVLGRVGHSDASHEAARREPVVGVELVLDAAHQVERRDRSPHVDRRLDGGRGVDDDGAAAVPARTPARSRSSAAATSSTGRAGRRRRRTATPAPAEPRSGDAGLAAAAASTSASPESTKVSLSAVARSSPVAARSQGYVAPPAGASAGLGRRRRRAGRGPSRPGRRRPSVAALEQHAHACPAPSAPVDLDARRARPGACTHGLREPLRLGAGRRPATVTQRLRGRQRVQPERRVGDHARGCRPSRSAACRGRSRRRSSRPGRRPWRPRRRRAPR